MSSIALADTANVCLNNINGMTSENVCKKKLGDSFAIFVIQIIDVFLLGINKRVVLLSLNTTLSSLLIYIFTFIWLAIIVIEIKRKNYKCYYAYLFAICNIGCILTEL